MLLIMTAFMCVGRHVRGRRWSHRAVATTLVCAVMLTSAVAAEPVVGTASRASSADVSSSPKQIRAQIDAAAKSLEGGERDAAVESLAAAIVGLETLAAVPRTPPGFKTLADRATGVRKQLEKAGVDVSMLTIPGPRTPTGQPPLPPVVGGRAAGVSFSRQVAPILARSCGGCHVAGRKGDFQMASYAGLMQTGMVQRGAGNASRLVEVILTGDMPRGGGTVSSADVATLIAWIDAGAACDAADPMIGIDVLARGGAAAPSAATTPAIRVVPVKTGEVSFATDVAPVLFATCYKCHGGDETEANFSMATVETLFRGGRSGPAIVAGKGADSLLVKKLRGAGIEGQRMPLGRPPLSDADTLLIENWISQGARLDMLTGKTPLETIVAAGQSKTLSDPELTQVRTLAGEKLWRRAIPDEPPVTESRAGVCVIGNLPRVRLVPLADTAEEVTARVRKELVADGPLLKGGVVLYAVKQAVDYSALWQNIAGAERPRGIACHAGVAGEVVYGAMLVPSADADDDVRAMLAETVASAACAGRGMPLWFSRGAGRAVAARVAPKADCVQQWKRDVSAALPKLGTPADFLAGHSEPAAATAAAGGFVTAIAAGTRLAQIIEALDNGATFDEAFAKVLKATPAQRVEQWAARGSR